MQDEMGLRISKGSVFVKIYKTILPQFYVLSELRHYFGINHAFPHLLECTQDYAHDGVTG